MLKTIASIVKEAESKTTDKAQAKVLSDNSSTALKFVIGFALDPAINWLLPPGNPPYRSLQKANDAEGRLYNDYKMLNYFVSSTEGKKINQIKREQLFIGFLESLDPDDAGLIMRVKNKELTITTKAAKLAFPTMTKDWP